MKLMFTALIAAIAAVLIAPDVAAVDASTTTWPSAAVRVAALGRNAAAGDVAWIRTVQLMGSTKLEAQRYPHLEDWVDLVTQLDPHFGTAYYFGAILLVTEGDRANRVDQLLARAEQEIPDDYSYPMARAFVAYFGKLDMKAAADHYARAASKPGAPKYLRQFSERLQREELECSSLMRDLRQQAEAGSAAQAQALLGERARIYEGCVKKSIERAADKFRVDHRRTPNGIDELFEAGLPRPQVTRPGSCWRYDAQSQHASLEACGG